MDICDQATDTERREREAALSRALARKPGRGPLWIDDRPCCRECEKEIPQARLDAVPGVELCVGCAE